MSSEVSNERTQKTESSSRIKNLERMTVDLWRQVTRTGGAYIPPKRMTGDDLALPAKDTEAYQRLSWDALRRSLNGLVNKVNASNLREIVRELIGENLIRGRGLFTRSIMKAQSASLVFTPVYAAVVAVLNTKLPMLGELLATRLIAQFRRSYRRNDKTTCVASVIFLAHLVNQGVLHDICVLQILMLLLERPTDDSVEIAVGLMKEVGAALGDLSPKPNSAIFERFRAVLNEGQIDKRVQYMIEVLFQIRKEGFKAHPAIPAELDLVEEEDQVTHYVMLDDEDLDMQDGLNIFKLDPEFEQHEAEYEGIRKEILGDGNNDSDSDGENEENGNGAQTPALQEAVITDKTDTNLINFRRTVYLTIQSSLDFEECGHKLLKMNIPDVFEEELCRMIIECASNERQYLRYHGLLAERFCKLDPTWREHFEQLFAEVYQTSHRLDTNRLRNVARLFAHLFESDAITWAVLECVSLTEEDTTAAGRIFLKFLFQDLSQYYGIIKLSERLGETDFEPYFSGIFPKDDAVRLRFSINFFTAIQLGGLTEEMRQRLKEIEEDVEEDEAQHDEHLFGKRDDQQHYAEKIHRSRSSPRSRSRSQSPSRNHRRHRSRSRDKYPIDGPRSNDRRRYRQV